MNLTPYEIKVIQECSGYAAVAHLGQTRKDATTPYIVHPARVAGFTYDYLKNGEYDYIYVAAAWLHDVMEDCSEIIKGEYSDIINNHQGVTRSISRFLINSKIITVADGIKIYDIVDALTMSQNKSIPKKERKRIYFEEMLKKEVEISVVKYCDRIDNLTTVHRFSQSGFKWYLEETKIMMESIAPLSEYFLFGRVHRMLISQLEAAKLQYKEMYG